MGVLPLQFLEGETAESLGIKGGELFSIEEIEELSPRQTVSMVIEREGYAPQRVKLLSRLDTILEVDYYLQGGILPYVLRAIVK